MFASAAEYNLAYPDAPIPAEDRERQHTHRFTGTGLTDDITGSSTTSLLSFLPAGIPPTLDEDRTGVVLASPPRRRPLPGTGRRSGTARSVESVDHVPA